MCKGGRVGAHPAHRAAQHAKLHQCSGRHGSKQFFDHYMWHIIMYGFQEERTWMMVEPTDSTLLSQHEKSWIRHGSNHSSNRSRELLQRAYNLLTLSGISAVTHRKDQNGFALFVRRNER